MITRLLTVNIIYTYMYETVPFAGLTSREVMCRRLYENRLPAGLKTVEMEARFPDWSH